MEVADRMGGVNNGDASFAVQIPCTYYYEVIISRYVGMIVIEGID